MSANISVRTVIEPTTFENLGFEDKVRSRVWAASRVAEFCPWSKVSSRRERIAPNLNTLSVLRPHSVIKFNHSQVNNHGGTRHSQHTQPLKATSLYVLLKVLEVDKFNGCDKEELLILYRVDVLEAPRPKVPAYFFGVHASCPQTVFDFIMADCTS